MIADPNKPFLNRAVSAWEPGSIFKTITLLAGLEDGKITETTTSDCPGYFQVGNRRFYCWIHSKGGSHGVVDYPKAIKFSCNVFFYEHGLDIGMTDIVNMARQFHLGERTGIPLAAYVYSDDKQGYVLREVEARGGLPDTERYYKGQIANTAIGQGDVRATPLQMAYVAAAFANGGTVWAPRLVDYFESQDESLPRQQRIEPVAQQMRGKLNVSPQHLAMVREAMLHVVDDEEGATGRKAYVPGHHIAGKTGTAQFPKRDPATGEMKLTGHHVWFITFGPFEEPRYAMALMVEEGDSGGTTCAPIAGKIYRKLFELENEKGSQFAVQGPRSTTERTENREPRTENGDHAN
jgi:penicillin-binding protein 2